MSDFGNLKLFECLSTLAPQFPAFAHVCLGASVGTTLLR